MPSLPAYPADQKSSANRGPVGTGRRRCGRGLVVDRSLSLGSISLGSISLGSVNLALLSLYFIPVWGRDAIRVLISPYNGLEDRAHAAAVIYVRQLFDLGFNGLVLTSHILAGVKLVIVAAFVSYLIEFARSLVIGRDADRATIDVVLILAVADILICVLPALALGDAAIVRLCATQMLLVAGATTIIVVERHSAPESESARASMAAGDTDAPRLDCRWRVLAAPERIPEARMRNPFNRF